MIDYYEPNLDLTLLGCGFLANLAPEAIQQDLWCLVRRVGKQLSLAVSAMTEAAAAAPVPYRRPHLAPEVPLCRDKKTDSATPRLHQHTPTTNTNRLLGVLLVAGVKLEIVLDQAMGVICQLRALLRNSYLIHRLSIADMIRQRLEATLPHNAHENCSGRLCISLTKLWTFENRLASQYESRGDLIDAIMAGCFIPGWSGSFTAPLYKGEKFVDGAYSNNSPKFPDELPPEKDETRKSTLHHVQVCAFANNVEVAPKDKHVLFYMSFLGHVYAISCKNMTRMLHAMLPYTKETYLDYVVCGHQNMKEFLFQTGLIKCRDCWHDHGKIAVIEKRACLSCLRLHEQVDSLTLPASVYNMFKK